MSEVGHNSANERLRSLIERVENLEAEKKSLGEDIKEIFIEAKSAGYDPKIMRKLIAIRRQDAAKRSEEIAVLAAYGAALGIDIFS